MPVRSVENMCIRNVGGICESSQYWLLAQVCRCNYSKVNTSGISVKLSGYKRLCVDFVFLSFELLVRVTY